MLRRRRKNFERMNLIMKMTKKCFEQLLDLSDAESSDSDEDCLEMDEKGVTCVNTYFSDF